MSSDKPWDRLLAVEKGTTDREVRARDEAGALVLKARAEALARRQTRLAAEMAQLQQTLDETKKALDADRTVALEARARSLEATPADLVGFRRFVLEILLGRP